MGIGVLGAIAALTAAFVARRRGQNPAKHATLFGGPLLLCAALWPLYNAVEDHFGLDSVAALAINLGIFLLVGALCGIGWTKFSTEPSGTTQTENTLP